MDWYFAAIEWLFGTRSWPTKFRRACIIFFPIFIPIWLALVAVAVASLLIIGAFCWVGSMIEDLWKPQPSYE